MKKETLAVLFCVCLLTVVGCEKLPGQIEPFALGPLKFGMTLAQVQAVFQGKQMELVAYDTPLGQTWEVIDPFGANPPQPLWMTQATERLTLTFWDDSLLRVRLNRPALGLDDLLKIRKKFDRGYDFTDDLSHGENLWLEYRAENMKIFLSGGSNGPPTISFVDQAAYRAMDVARNRWKEDVVRNFSLDGLRFEMKEVAVAKALAKELTPSDFFTGLESRQAIDETNGLEWYFGFDKELGLTAIARVHQKRWTPAQVQATMQAWTKQFGQGETRRNDNGYTVVIDCLNLRVSLIVMECSIDGCAVSEGWLWAGPSL